MLRMRLTSTTCRPVPVWRFRAPQSPEIYHYQCYDAYASDVYSLGVILYSLLTQRPAYKTPEESDVWFATIYGGEWLDPRVMAQDAASVYNHLPKDALELIDMLMKPQLIRPSIDQILQSPFFRSTEESSTMTPAVALIAPEVLYVVMPEVVRVVSEAVHAIVATIMPFDKEPIMTDISSIESESHSKLAE
jgi:serine/threonine protein kinase